MNNEIEKESRRSKLESVYDLFRRLPPSQLETNLNFVTSLLDDDDENDNDNIIEEIEETIDLPLKIHPSKGFLMGDFNRDGDCYRNPIDNQYYEEESLEAVKNGNDEFVRPSERLRKMEIEGNKVFGLYTRHYYGKEGMCSLYNGESENGFVTSVMIKKVCKGKGQRGIWDSIHTVEVIEKKGKVAEYNLVSTVMLSMETEMNQMSLCGQIQERDRVVNKKFRNDRDHLTNIGNLIQKMENRLRISLDSIYFDKTREITNTIRRSGIIKNDLFSMEELSKAVLGRRRMKKNN